MTCTAEIADPPSNDSGGNTRREESDAADMLESSVSREHGKVMGPSTMAIHRAIADGRGEL